MSADPAPVTIAVAPTLSQVVSIDVRTLGRVTMAVQNLDATQTMSGFLRQKVAPSMGYALSPSIALSTIAPAGSVDTDGNPTDCVSVAIDCGGFAVIEMWARASGVGGNVKYALRKAGPK